MKPCTLLRWPAWLFLAAELAAQGPLPGTKVMTAKGDLSAQMVAGISRFLDGEIAASDGGREAFWRADFSSPAAYVESIRPNRERLARILGAVDPRLPQPELEYVATIATPVRVAETDRFTAYAVRWPVFEGVHGEGLLLQPKGRLIARVVAIPDADQTPEIIAGLSAGLPAARQYARRLAENGCQVVIPVLADRSDRFSNTPRLGPDRYTNLPHREWIYRQAFTMGRHVIGYEVQKILAAIDWLARQDRDSRTPIGATGWGEGALLAFYGAALDPRLDAVLVSGYFGKRERVWDEPIYRNVFGLLREFGDARIARLIAPRSLIVEHGPAPDVPGPPSPRIGRTQAAPGRILTPVFEDVRAEIERARQLAGPFSPSLQFHHGPHGATVGPLADDTLLAFLRALRPELAVLEPAGTEPVELRPDFDDVPCQERTVREMERFTQRLLQLAMDVRDEFLWRKVPPTTPAAWREAMRPYREKFWNEIIGRFPTGPMPLNPRSRLLIEKPAWTGYEVMLDVLPDVYAWGYFLVPKGIKPGEKRPVVVAQHGLEGLPNDVIKESPPSGYRAFAARLAERGFIVFAPHNPYRGDDRFRVLQRKANPLGKSLFSIIIAQHERILAWLATQPNVDPARIGFYGLSYGGKTAMRVPAVLEGYALSICSADFNEWIWKNVTTDSRNVYMYGHEYEMPDFNLGPTFNYAEMAALIAPRAFMVERGHNDGVGIDEWVAFEYARVRRLYNKLKIPGLTEIEYFDGPHAIHGVGTYEFLHRHLQWPAPAASPKAETRSYP